MFTSMASTPISPRTLDLVQALFSEDERETACRLLEDGCGGNLPFLSELNSIELERYRFAALRVSQGTVKGLESAISLAKTDWRDLLMEADFGHDTRAHEDWCAKTLRSAGSAL